MSLQDSVERAIKDVAEMHQLCNQENAALKAENERLRTALEKMATLQDDMFNGASPEHCVNLGAKYARTALNPEATP